VTDTFYSQNNYSGSDIGFNSILCSSVQNQTEQLPFNGVYKMSYWSLLIMFLTGVFERTSVFSPSCAKSVAFSKHCVKLKVQLNTLLISVFEWKNKNTGEHHHKVDGSAPFTIWHRSTESFMLHTIVKPHSQMHHLLS